ncbi:MAG: T9SS type A sorting domain-containing protein [Bacteroidetes bacterium]|nr:T9SS type A sorting domain-containing protein [Bacteroidota bacterium]
MKNKKLTNLLIPLLLAVALMINVSKTKAQSVLKVFPEWASTTGSQNFFYKNIVKTDASNNVYIAGATKNGSGNYDILVAKYNSAGVQQWIQQYNGAGNGDDMATSLFVDASSNVYITGTVTTATNLDVITIKYNSSGTQQWLSTYNGTGSSYDSGAEVKVDASGNVYITGSSYNASGNTDIIVIKYNSSGVQQFASRYNYTSNMNDAGVKLTIGTNIVTTGVVQTATNAYKMCSVSFNLSTGAYVSSKISATANITGIDVVNDMVEDAAGNIYIAGGVPIDGEGYNYDIIKLNSSDLSIAWERTYNTSSNLDDIASGIKVDASGNVYVTGTTTSTTQNKNMTTIKYNSSGTQQWVQTYNDALNGNDEANAIALDASNNVYITGYITTEIDKKDYQTIKYNNSGTEIWTIHSDATSHLNDIARDIAIDNNGDILIAGESETGPNTYTYYTIKYIEKSILTPTDYNSETPPNSFSYYRNMGQLIGTNDSLVPSIKYYVPNSNPQFYIKNNSSSFVFARFDTSASASDTLHRVDVTYFRPNTAAKTYPLEERKDYSNFFLAHCGTSGITEVHGNTKLITSNIYNNIDLMYSSNLDGIKYYYIVKPGGNPADIQITYTGASSFNLDGSTNALTINTSIGNLTYERPTAYQVNSSNTVVSITGWQCAWQTNGASNQYKFYTSTYNTALPLIIQVDMGHSVAAIPNNGDPGWSTYFGGSDVDQINDIKSDVNKNLFIVGETRSANFPLFVSTTSYQPNIAGNIDGFVAKFHSDGAPTWLTYIGGTRSDKLTSFDFAPNGDIYCVGNTTSGDIIMKSKSGAYNDPTFVGPDDATYGWLCDGFIFQIAQDGLTTPWRTYYTANSDDRFNKCKFDASGNFFVVGQTASSNAPVVATGSQYSHAWAHTTPISTTVPFIMDGYIVRFDQNSARTWATCIGASTTTSYVEDDYLYNLDFDAAGNLYTVGQSSGNNYPNIPSGSGSTLSTNYSQQGNNKNGVITSFNNSGNILWSSYFGSTNIQGVRIKNGSVYITGATGSSYLPTVPSGQYYSHAWNTGSSDAFFAAYNNLNQLIHSTFLGGSGDDQGTSIEIDATNAIYIAGKSTSTNFPLPTGGNPTNTYDHGNSGLQDYFICALYQGYTDLAWSTLVGGNDNESSGWGFPVSISIDGNNHLHLAGQSRSSSLFPLYDGGGLPVYFQSAKSGVYDGTITRFELQPIQLMGVNENGNIGNCISVFPNPVSSILTIKVNSITENQIYNVYNNLGQTIASGKIIEKSTIINMETLASGIYVLTVSDAKTSTSAKFIKK